jgi:hypothetical protein
MAAHSRKKAHICKQCGTKFRGVYCPFCGVEYGASRRPRAHSGVLAGLLRFLCTIIALAVVLIVALAVLDSTAYAHDPAHTTVYAVLQSVRNAVPSDALAVYDFYREQTVIALRTGYDAVYAFFAEAFS